MKRCMAIKIISSYVDRTSVCIYTTGMISREAYDIKDRKANLYMIGSMGLVSSVGLGIALNTKRRVFVFDGDGSILMDMGTLATIGAQAPENFVHIVLDNESYESTGGQPTSSHAVKLHKVARACGYRYAAIIRDEPGLRRAMKQLDARKGPCLILAKATDKYHAQASRVNINPAGLKRRFMSYVREGR